MRLRNVRLENFTVFKKAELGPLEDFTVIVGRNGSGKSFLLEALNAFFSEFQLSGGASAWQGNADFWHGRVTSSPIRVHAELELSGGDMEQIFAAAQDVLGEVLADIGKATPDLVVERELISGKGWKTVTITLAGRELVHDDAPASDVIVKQPRKRDPALDEWTLTPFPASVETPWSGSPRLLVKKGTTEAFHSDERVDALVEASIVALAEPEVGTDYAEWAASQGYSVTPRAPAASEAPELQKAYDNLKKYPAQAVSAALVERVKASWKLVPAVREEPRTPGQRVSALPPAAVDETNSILADRAPAAQQRSRKLEQAFKRFTAKTLNYHTQGLLVDDDRQRLPFGHQGGGEQAVLGLAKQVLEAPAIVAVEEPEAHLHPHLARDAFRFFKDQAGRSQIIVSTHSPMMMDKQVRTNNWLCRVTEDGSAVLERIEEEEDIRLALAELGSVPSDAYTKDVVLLAEGATETEAAFPIWAATLERPFPDNVGLIALAGKGKVTGHLEIWLNIMQHSPARFIVALDANAVAEKRGVLRKMKVPQDAIELMPWECLEDVFPEEIITAVFRELFDIDLAEEGEKLPKSAREAWLKDVIRKKKAERPHWKMEFARAVASQMSPKQVPKVFAKLLNRLYKLLP